MAPAAQAQCAAGRATTDAVRGSARAGAAPHGAAFFVHARTAVGPGTGRAGLRSSGGEDVIQAE